MKSDSLEIVWLEEWVVFYSRRWRYADFD